MSSHIPSLLISFSDYISTYIVTTNQKTNELHISFVYNTYDLVDKNLDFDEEYYSKIMINLRKVLFQECKTLVDSETIQKATIMCSKLVMSNLTTLEHEMTIDRSSSSIVSYVNTPCF